MGPARRAMVVTAAVCGATGLAHAQPLPAPEPASVQAVEPTIEITASIHMDSVKFSQTGDSKAEVWAEPGGKGKWALDSPLPKPIPVGKTYKNVDLKLRAAATVDETGAATIEAGAAAGEPAPSATAEPQ